MHPEPRGRGFLDTDTEEFWEIAHFVTSDTAAKAPLSNQEPMCFGELSLPCLVQSEATAKVRAVFGLIGKAVTREACHFACT